MNKVLISHEIPKVLFPYHDLISDFPYVLAHLLDEDKQYSHFYKQKLQEAPYSILDCSAFELGEAIDSDDLWDLADRYEPTHLVLPDKIHDKNFTIEKSTEFARKYGDKSTNNNLKFIGVVQGQTFDELMECAKAYISLSLVDIIAIPFHCLPSSAADNNIVPRVIFFRNLISDKFFNKKIHFLGVESISELLLYTEDEKSKIYSVDTSSPIINGWNNIRYKECGTSEPKPKEKLADNIDKKLTYHQIEDIVYNVAQFKQYLNS